MSGFLDCRNGFDGLGAELVDLLLPMACAGCGRRPRAGRPLCAACDAALPRLPPDLCARCQQSALRPADRRHRCAGCASHTSSLDPLFACLAAVPFEGAAAEWVRRYKYPAPGLAGLDPRGEAVVAALVAEAATRAPAAPPEAVIPVPLHPARLQARGFDATAGLARSLARRHGLPFAPSALRRTRDTPSQTGLGRAGRRRNVAGAFHAPGPAPGRALWLVDDVVTTGATLEAAAEALRQAGARSVVALTAARTPGPAFAAAEGTG